MSEAVLNHETRKALGRSRLASGVVFVAAIGVLAATILAAAIVVRLRTRSQLLEREAEGLYAVTLLEQLEAEEGDPDFLGSDPAGFGFEAALRASRLRGVLGIRLYDADGEFYDAVPATIQPVEIHPTAWRRVRQGKAQATFREDLLLSEVFIYLPEFATGPVRRIPVVQVTVPLHGRGGDTLAGAADFLMAGEALAAQYARLDRTVALQAGAAFFVAAGMLVAFMWPTLRQMRRLQQLLAERNERLQRANQELSLAARTAAIGAVSAHLMHGLRNPLASLQEYVATRPSEDGPNSEEDWHDAVHAARRAQALVDRTLEVLSDTHGGAAFTLDWAEWIADLRNQCLSLATRRGVRLEVDCRATHPVDNRVAGLTGLILLNLLENALQVSPAGTTVRLAVEEQDAAIVCSVEDQGPGFPEHLRSSLFLPCRSTQEGGSGIGLAISKQLADHLGATLELETPPGSGCRFYLRLPRTRLATPLSSSPVSGTGN